MNILPSIYKESIHFIEQSFIPTLTLHQKRISALAIAAFACLAACYSLFYYCARNWKVNASEHEDETVFQQPIEPQNIPEIRSTASFEYSHGNRLFAFDVLEKKIAESNTDNLLISPLGISFLLSMIKHGVGPDDQAEIERIIHLPRDETELKVCTYEAIKELTNNGFDIAGLLYLNPNYRLDPYYQALASQYYQSYAGTGNSADEVNAWVKKATNGQIGEIINQNDLVDFFLVLANAIHFKAKWVLPFDADDTKHEDFTTPTQKVRVKMMHQTDECDYYEDDDCKAIRLGYRNNESSMLLILPNKDNDFSFVNNDKIEAIVTGLKPAVVDMSVPKFKLEQEINVKQMLKEMGMEHLFEQPDFTHLVDMSDSASKNIVSQLSIDQIKQKSVLEFDEEGTEASTVTVATFVAECFMMPPESDKTIRFDRPFLSILRCGRDPILGGVIRDPSA